MADVPIPSRCGEKCWTPLPCPDCGRTMNPRGRSAPLGMECLREPCPADDSRVNPRHLWDENDEERWRFYPDEAPRAGGVTELEDKLADEKARVVQLEAQLAEAMRYTVHRPICFWRPGVTHVWQGERPPCTCGYDALAAAVSVADSGPPTKGTTP